MKEDLSPKLSSQERRHFTACNQKITAELRTCFEIGATIADVRDNKLYREDYATFEEYCQDMFNISRAHAYRLIAAADVEAEMSPMGDKPTNERQARELKKLPPAKRAEAMEEAADAGPVTAKAIAEVKEKEAKGEPVFDATGLIIREAMVPLWNRAGEVRKLMTAVSNAKTALEHAQEEDDPLFRPITVVGPDGQSETWSGLIAALTNAYRALKLAIPYAICPACSTRIKNCTTCWGRGFVSEHFWKVQTAKETRAIRANVVKQQQEAAR